MIFGELSHIKQMDQQLQQPFLIKRTGELNGDGSEIKFLGRRIRKKDQGVLMYEDAEYYEDILKEMQMDHCKESSTPTASRNRHQSSWTRKQSTKSSIHCVGGSLANFNGNTCPDRMQLSQSRNWQGTSMHRRLNRSNDSDISYGTSRVHFTTSCCFNRNWSWNQ